MNSFLQLRVNGLLFFLVSIYPFTFVHLIDMKVSGISLSFLRDAFFLFIIFYFLIFRGKESLLLKSKNNSNFLFLMGFVLYFLGSFLTSESKWLVFPVCFRFILVTLIGYLLLTIDVDLNDAKKFYKMISLSLGLYCLFSLILYPIFGFSEAGGLNGLGGQHFSKFTFLLSAIFFLTCFIENHRSKYNLFFLIISLVCVILVLQRGAIISLLVSTLAILTIGNIRRKVYGVVIFITTFPIFAYLVLHNESIMQYAFFDSYGPDVLIDSILNGTFDFSYIRSRGRFEIMDVVFSSGDPSLFGFGAGYSKALLSEYFFDGKEVHNDIIFILYDLGYIGLVLFFLFFIRLFVFSDGFSQKDNDYYYVHTLYVFSKSAILGLFIWMMLSNVMVYMTYSLMLPLLVMCFLDNIKCKIE